MMSSLAPFDAKLLCFCQDRMRAGRGATLFPAIRLRFGLKSNEHAKQVFADLVEHLTHAEIHSFQIAHRGRVIRA